MDLKFRVRPLVRMPVSVMFGKLQEFADTGIAPADIEVAYMEYAHGRGRSYTPGQRLQPHEHEEFKKFHKVLTSITPQEVQHERKSGKYRRNPDPTLRVGKPE